MKKSSLTLTCALLLSCLSIKSQQSWSTQGNTAADNFFLGTNNNKPLNFSTNGELRMVLDGLGRLSLTDLSGGDGGIVVVNSSGVLSKLGTGTSGALACNSIYPWFRGGNTVGGQVNANTIGTCDNYDFVLKAFDKKSLFLTAANSYVGIGHNNTAPTAQLDICDPASSNAEHLKFYGDMWGTIESTNMFDFHFGAQGFFRISSGSPGPPVLNIGQSGKIDLGRWFWHCKIKC